MVRYIGIDPSTKTGFVILTEHGRVLESREIKTRVESDPQRFMIISDEIAQEVQEGDKVVIEGFSYGSKGKGVSTQYGIGWTIRTDLVTNKIPYIEVPPTTLKKFATGKGNVKKEDMILPIYKRWGYENDSDNIRDAFILAQIGRALDGLGEPTKAQMDCIKGLAK
jgi:crossover junction endodeoxyribonuclease RuvC